MRILFVVLLFLRMLVAEDEEICFSIQLLSIPDTQKNKDILSSENYPLSCTVMEIGQALTVRCGCYETTNEAKKNLLKFTEQYKDAKVTSTYKYRFFRQEKTDMQGSALPGIDIYYARSNEATPQAKEKKIYKRPFDHSKEEKVVSNMSDLPGIADPFKIIKDIAPSEREIKEKVFHKEHKIDKKVLDLPRITGPLKSSPKVSIVKNKVKDSTVVLKASKEKDKNNAIRQPLKNRFENEKKYKEKTTVALEPSLIEERYDFNISKVNLLPVLGDEKLATENKLLNVIDAFSENEKQQIVRIQNNSGFFGLSMQGKYDQYTHQKYLNREYTDYEYNLKIKYDILKNGYYEKKIKDRETLHSTQIFYYQDLINLEKYNYDANLENLDTLLSKIEVQYYTELVAMYQDAIKRKEKLLEHGDSAKYEVDTLINEKEKFLSLRDIYKKRAGESVDKNIYELLSKIDEIRLKDIAEVQEYAKNNNPDILIQKAKFDFYAIPKSFSDNIVLNAYASRRTMDEVGWYNTVGAEVDIPLDFSSSENKQLNHLQKNAADIKRKGIEQSVENSLIRLYVQFSQLQSLIAADKNVIENQYRQLDNFMIMAKYKVPNLKTNAEQNIFALQTSILDTKHNVLLKRLEMLKIILNISFLSNTHNIKNLLKESE